MEDTPVGTAEPHDAAAAAPDPQPADQQRQESVDEDLAAGLRQRMGVSNGEQAQAEPTSGEETSDEPAREGVSAEAAPQPDGETAPPSRREQERRQHEEEKTSLRSKLEQTERELTAEREAARTRQEAALQARGDDERYDRLSKAAKRGEWLSSEDSAWLSAADLAREHEDAWVQRAAKEYEAYAGRFRQGLAAEALRAATLPNADPEKIKTDPSFEAICRHFHEAGAASKDAEYRDRYARQDGELKELRAKVARYEGRSAPSGGRSGGGTAGMPDADAEPLEQIAAGMRLRTSRRAS